ncbi:MAG: biopolymer transporter ExbD [Deinococcales bacterium]
MREPRGRTRLRASPSIDLTPMVDVVFLLVIFFMVSTTFITMESGLPVDLPSAQTAVTEPSTLPTVTITKDDQIFVGGRVVSQAQVVDAVRQQMASSGYTTVVLRADTTVEHGLVVRVMDLIKQAGAKRLAIATGG